MQKGQICILVDGIKNIAGHHALELKENFNITRYPNQSVGTDYYYVLFDNNLDKRDKELSPINMFPEFMIYLGLRGYAFRLDRAFIYGDTAIDYVMKIGTLITQLNSMPKDLGNK